MDTMRSTQPTSTPFLRPCNYYDFSVLDALATKMTMTAVQKTSLEDVSLCLNRLVTELGQHRIAINSAEFQQV